MLTASTARLRHDSHGPSGSVKGPLPQAWPKFPLAGTATIHPTFKTQDESLLRRLAFVFLQHIANTHPHPQLLTFDLLNVSIVNKNALYILFLKQ